MFHALLNTKYQKTEHTTDQMILFYTTEMMIAIICFLFALSDFYVSQQKTRHLVSKQALLLSPPHQHTNICLYMYLCTQIPNVCKYSLQLHFRSRNLDKQCAKTWYPNLS